MIKLFYIVSLINSVMIRSHMQITSLSRALFVALAAGTLVSAYADPVAPTPAPKTAVTPAATSAVQPNFPKRRPSPPNSLKNPELTILTKNHTLTPPHQTQSTTHITTYINPH